MEILLLESVTNEPLNVNKLNLIELHAREFRSGNHQGGAEERLEALVHAL